MFTACWAMLQWTQVSLVLGTVFEAIWGVLVPRRTGVDRGAMALQGTGVASGAVATRGLKRS